MIASPFAAGTSLRSERRAVFRGGAVLAFGVALFATGVARAQSCPAEFPYDCGTGSCATDAASCVDPDCPDGYPYDCGDGTCASDAGACIDPNCPEGYPHDCGNGTCSSSVEGCSGDGTAPGGNGSSEPSCEPAEAVPDGCASVESCNDGTQAWYVTDDGTKFFCASITDCAAAEQEVLSYCDEQSGCAASPGRPGRGGGASGIGIGAMIGIAVAAAVRAARRRPRPTT